MDMEIKHEEKAGGGRFYIDDEGKPTGELTYRLSSKTMDIDHTEVNDKFRGEGLGQDLVNAAVKYGREKDLDVTASCPYAKKVMGEKQL